MVGDMENLKVRVKNEDESREVQEYLEFLGIRTGIKTLTEYIYANFEDREAYNYVMYPEKYKKITIQQLKDLVALKRNDISDANFKDTFGDIWYVDSNNNYLMFENSIWREAEEPLFKLEPIKKLDDKEVKMKEYLDTDYELRSVKQTSGDNHAPESWIEVPEGAEEYRSNYKFYKNNGGLYYSPYEEWVKSGIYPYKTLWQRNPEKPNTLIQEKLKFIEKWLNGEKIQYILGVESDKTQ